MDIFQDGINADRYAGDYKHLKTIVKSGDKVKIHLAPGGGWASQNHSRTTKLSNQNETIS